jgi:hypothetical protein
MVTDFYSSKDWRMLRRNIIIQRGMQCNRCKGVYAMHKLIGHHIIPLTDSNINNPNITLNADNVEIICQTCHNNEHYRFSGKQSVVIVWGSPLSGKAEYVNDVMRYGDIVLDIDNVWQCITNQDRYIKPDMCRNIVFGIRDKFLDMIMTRTGNWYNAYIITADKNYYEVEKLNNRLGATIVKIESSRAECLDKAPLELVKYINDWWDKNTPPTY